MTKRALSSPRSVLSTPMCECCIIPPDVLERLSQDTIFSEEERKVLSDMVKFEKEWRKLRVARTRTMRSAANFLTTMEVAAPPGPPTVSVFNCRQQTTLPGVLIPKPDTSSDSTAKRAFEQTTEVASFYKSVFGRSSIDNRGMSLNSSIHYGVKYNNAFWNGTQMTYGDGDGSIFVDFTASNDVIAHELTHGVTQYTLRLNYTNQAGGLNESMSDVFGTLFRQWSAGQDVNKADWLIGSDIMGPAAKNRGFKCLRDMANPASNHCLAPQPMKFSQYRDGMDPHESSGIPNHAFYLAAMAVGGKSWEKVGKVWYQAMVGTPSPSMKMSTFANRTRTLAGTLFPSEPAVKSAIDTAWKKVEL